MESAGGGTGRIPKTPKNVRFITGVETPRPTPARTPAPRVDLTPAQKQESHALARERLKLDPPTPGTVGSAASAWSDASYTDIAETIQHIMNAGAPSFAHAADPPQPDSPRPLKRRRKGPEELTYLPDPIRLDFQPHPLEDRSDAWFTEQFRLLFRRTSTFAEVYFGIQSLSQREIYQPWAAGLTPELVRYAEQVAEADPATGGWDPLLKDTTQRKWLIAGILVRILQVKVFGQNLWGSSTAEEQLLHELDRAFFTREGFARQALRSEAARTVIGQGAVTQNFWSEVATLTAQVSVLLKPLTDYLYNLPGGEAVEIPELRDQYQSLHNLISHAAYLSLCIRLSPTIFYFTDVVPGAPFDNDEQASLEMELYSQSKQAVVDAHAAARRTHQRNLRVANREVARLTAENANKWRLGRAQRKVAVLGPAPLLPIQTHRAMAKIGVWPGIRRFKAGSSREEKEDQRKFLGDKDGFRIYDIGKAAIVCYFGPQVRTAKDRVALAKFVRNKESVYWSLVKWYGFSVTVGVGIVGVAAATCWRKEIQGKTGIDVGGNWGDFKELCQDLGSKIW